MQSRHSALRMQTDADTAFRQNPVFFRANGFRSSISRNRLASARIPPKSAIRAEPLDRSGLRDLKKYFSPIYSIAKNPTIQHIVYPRFLTKSPENAVFTPERPLSTAENEPSKPTPFSAVFPCGFSALPKPATTPSDGDFSRQKNVVSQQPSHRSPMSFSEMSFSGRPPPRRDRIPVPFHPAKAT